MKPDSYGSGGSKHYKDIVPLKATHNSKGSKVVSLWFRIKLIIAFSPVAHMWAAKQFFLPFLLHHTRSSMYVNQRKCLTTFHISKKQKQTKKPPKSLLHFFNFQKIEQSFYVTAKSMSCSKAKSYVLQIPQTGAAIKEFAVSTTSSCWCCK